MSQVSNGTILNNKYRVDAFLQEGGMGQVYNGTDIATNKDILIKFVRYHHNGHDSIREDKLKIEAKVLKKIQHPNIVKYIDDDIDAEHGFFLVLEYIKGASLKDIYYGKTCPEHDLNNICITLLNVVNNLHNINILHRCISPDDIMISDDGEIILIDFGAVKEGFSGLNQSVATRIGKPDYGPPEQLQGYPTYQSDIFSVGATMWFLVTGQPPRSRDKNGRILSAKFSNHSVSDHIDSIILKATDPDVANRYQTADEMIQALMISSDIEPSQVPNDTIPNGTILNSKYQVDALLLGGMNEIYKGKEILTDKEIVIKVGEAKLKHEAKILKKIQHPNIVKYIDDDIDAEHGFFLVLEHIKGASLKNIYTGKTCPEHDLNDICITLLNALQYLHNMNIVHRRVSPDTIIVSDEEELKLIGFRKAIEVSTAIKIDDGTTLIGNEYFLAFQAPERLMGYPTYQSDIFSVGATMWFLITGQPPRIRNQNGMILSAKTSNHSVSDHIDSIILKATNPDVANRYQTADEMIQALMISSQ